MADILQEKSYNFALRIVKLSEYLNDEKREYVLSKKNSRLGNKHRFVDRKGKQGESRSDFFQKYSVANKEAFKSHFLLRLLRDSKFISAAQADSLLSDCGELQGLLISSLRTARKNP